MMLCKFNPCDNHFSNSRSSWLLKSLRSSTKTILYLIVPQYFFQYKARLVKRPVKQRAFTEMLRTMSVVPQQI